VDEYQLANPYGSRLDSPQGTLDFMGSVG